MVKRYRGGLITANLSLTSVDTYTTSRLFAGPLELAKPRYIGINFTPPQIPISLLLVGAGGAGGTSVPGNSGGGGAGGFLQYFSNANILVSGGVLTVVTVGSGGVAPASEGIGINGSNSNIIISSTNYIAYGGGGGGAEVPADPLSQVGRPGGSGGGNSAYGAGPGPGRGLGIDGQGNPGGLGHEQPGISYTTAGGGGAGSVGGNGVFPTAGAGGYGIYSTITGSNVAYAGGGGGYNYSPSVPSVGAGGIGGGGPGGNTGNVNTGGGGGFNKSGGSGIVVINHPTSYPLATTTGSPNVIYADSNIIYRFWQSGTIIWY